MQRLIFKNRIKEFLKTFPVVALLGPRQCGKTSLAREMTDIVDYFDLEDPTDLARLMDPKLALARYETGLVVIDEIQRIPDLFPLLRVLADRPKTCQFLILGSSGPGLLRQSAETLAGRIGYLELTPFSLTELEKPDKNTLWLRGGFPRSYLADNDSSSMLWREQYIMTFLERDLPQLGIQVPAPFMRRFWMMLAHYHGQTVNISEYSRALGVSQSQINYYLDALTQTLMLRQLQPFWVNIKKRQVKAPKIYLRDTGLLHALLNIQEEKSLQGHPKIGASWEGFAIEEIIRYHQAPASQCFFWGTHQGAELDLLLDKDHQSIGFECKYASNPKLTPSLKIAIDTLPLKKIWVIYPGDKRYLLHDNIEAIGLEMYLSGITSL